jgi:hypothetical protein
MTQLDAIGLSTLGAGGIACGLVLTGLGIAVLGNTFGEWGEQGADVVYEIQK